MSAVAIVVNQRRSALELHSEAMRVSKDLKAHYLKLFELLLEIESRQIYYQFEITSLHSYCVELLELSPSLANDFINVVRKSIEVPELAATLRTQKLTISKARKICSVLDSKNSKEWIDLAVHCPCRVVEKAVALANPREAVVESIKYVAGDVLELKIGVSEEWTELLMKTKDLLSQKKCRNVPTEEALFILMAEYCQKNDPVEKAKRAIAKSKRGLNVSNASERGAERAYAKLEHQARKLDNHQSSAALTRYRPKAVEHLVDLRDQNRCTYVMQNGKRCEQQRWLDKHHLREFHEGGTHVLGNLETLCHGHHKIKHLTRAERRSR